MSTNTHGNRGLVRRGQNIASSAGHKAPKVMKLHVACSPSLCRRLRSSSVQLRIIKNLQLQSPRHAMGIHTTDHLWWSPTHKGKDNLGSDSTHFFIR